jgi:hypothetical protein
MRRALVLAAVLTCAIGGAPRAPAAPRTCDSHHATQQLVDVAQRAAPVEKRTFSSACGWGLGCVVQQALRRDVIHQDSF